jgi:pimeloyl-ACP methyl ester carboxylesterase
MEQVEVQGLRIAYRRRGDGPPLVLLHGWPTDSREWRRQIDALSDGWTVVAWDAPGAGRSSDPPETFGLPDWADILAAFIDQLGLSRPHVAGLSFGGGLALELYRRHPRVPRTLILVGAYAGWAGSLRKEEVERRLHFMLANCDRPPNEWAPALVSTLLSDQASDGLVAEVTSIVSSLHPSATKIALRAFAETDLRHVLPRVNVPTLLLYGEQDVRTGPDVWQPLHEGIPGSKLVLIPDAGHVVHMGAPDRFNAEVRAFLDEVSPSSRTIASV